MIDIQNDENWRIQDCNAITCLDELCRHVAFPADEKAKILKACKRFPLKVSRYYLNLIDADDPDCPLRKMAIPDVRELIVSPYELADPIGDTHSALNNQPRPALVHRYQDRVVFMPTTLCGMYCRHCFRRRLAGKHEQNPTQEELDSALSYIESTAGIREVILSGGDPLMMDDAALFIILARIQAAPHVRVLRIHTRMPAVTPYRITDELVAGLSRFRPLWLVTHFNHPRELTGVAIEKLRRLTDAGIPLLNQSVLLKGVNDRVDVLRDLGWGLIEAGVKPYYLHHLDLAQGLGHFRVSIEKGVRLIRELQGTLPGYAIPRYVLDVPEGYGKVPVQYCYLNRMDVQRYQVEAPDGTRVEYLDMG
ncbi:MAG: KamA family radical SAM protein [Deltaproteobacteria bacterium]|nr:KamA family radical SAM protein [Deltaproteobacteria bacterium]